MKTQEEFFQEHQVEGVLSPEKMTQMLTLGQGDTVVEPTDGSAPAAASTETVTPPKVEEVASTATPPVTEPVAEDDKPKVILAKDGVHTIGYEKLVEARDAEKAAKAQADAATAEAERLRLEIEALKKPATPAATTDKPAATPADQVDFGDFSDEALKKGIDKLVAVKVAQAVEGLQAQVAQQLAPVQLKAAQTEAEKHWSTLYSAHPDLDSIVESKELNDWIESKPSFARPGYRQVLTDGATAQVVEMVDAFKKETGKTAAPAAVAAPAPQDAAAVAKAAIANAQSKPPSSLTEIAGSTAHHDEAGAMLEMSPTALMNKFAGKSPEQIEALLSRLV